MLRKIFQIVSFYDSARWKSATKKNLINFYKKDINDDTKLLTHWLCYITDRQMAFKRIWNIGGFVFSELADKFPKEQTLELLNPTAIRSFIRKNKKGSYSFTSHEKVNKNTILLNSYAYSSENRVEFTPRYYPSDYFSILYTLDILSSFNYSLGNFLATAIKKHNKKEDLIPRVLFSLYLLSYFKIGQPKKDDIANFKTNLQTSQKRKKEVLEILNNPIKFEKEFDKFKENTIFKQKRAWCSLRDFFKLPEFREYFKNILKEEGIEFEKLELFSLKYLQQFELAGDVWNNNSKFRKCILENTKYQNSTKPLNKILREYFEEHKKELSTSYPEQFDITFDFVPRMCEQDNCDICPIGFIKKKNNFQKTCIKESNFYCPVALHNCNYIIDCEGECSLLQSLKS